MVPILRVESSPKDTVIMNATCQIKTAEGRLRVWSTEWALDCHYFWSHIFTISQFLSRPPVWPADDAVHSIGSSTFFLLEALNQTDARSLSFSREGLARTVLVFVNVNLIIFLNCSSGSCYAIFFLLLSSFVLHNGLVQIGLNGVLRAI